MSGGHFNYSQYRLQEIADEIQQVVETNDSTELNEWGGCIGREYTPETIARFNEAIKVLKAAQVYAQRIDWLLSGDDGEDSFHARLAKDMAELGWAV